MFCSTLFSNTFTLRSSLSVRNQASHPCKTGKIIIPNTVTFTYLETKLEDKRICSDLWHKFFDYICLLMKKKLYTCDSSLTVYPHPSSKATLEGGQANFVSVTHKMQFPPHNKTLNLQFSSETSPLC
jgi:hypothetical protein